MPSAPFDVDIKVEDVGGPSAGLMLTLGIVDLAGDEDLTGGEVIAGTGTIDDEGHRRPDRRHHRRRWSRARTSAPSSSWCRRTTAPRLLAAGDPACRWPR